MKISRDALVLVVNHVKLVSALDASTSQESATLPTVHVLSIVPCPYLSTRLALIWSEHLPTKPSLTLSQLIIDLANGPLDLITSHSH